MCSWESSEVSKQLPLLGLQSANFFMDETSPAEASLTLALQLFYVWNVWPLKKLELVVFFIHRTQTWKSVGNPVSATHQHVLNYRPSSQTSTVPQRATLVSTTPVELICHEGATLALAKVICIAYYTRCVNCKWTFLSSNLLWIVNAGSCVIRGDTGDTFSSRVFWGKGSSDSGP